jgi:A/G-specific adenine glycosylase
MSNSISPAPRPLVSHLLDWIRIARRDFPWRRRRDPYAVWIAEVMLQQTQAATVVPYFERWLARFPDLPALAVAPLDDVLKVWEGLGYYGRARNLHRMAGRVMAEHGGQIPGDKRALLALPGIGRYTAGALLSLAFGQAEPVLDGNVRRVLCRVCDIAADPAEAATERQLWEIATALVIAAPAGMAGDLNEALMELGATICTPGKPACAACPVADLCLAHARGVAAARPAVKPKPPAPHHVTVAGVIQDAAGAYLLIQRPAAGLLGGLWGFPGGILREDETLDAGLRRTVQEQIGVEVLPGEPVTRMKHAYTHFRITLHALRGQLVAGEPRPVRCAAVRWVAPGTLPGLAFPVTDAKIIRALT